MNDCVIRELKKGCLTATRDLQALRSYDDALILP